MIERYKNAEIEVIWLDENKLRLWQKTELAVILAKVNLRLIDESVYLDIERLLTENQINLIWWKEKEKDISHDLAAFVEERLRFLPVRLQKHFHENMTSYDTEEAAFATMIKESIVVVKQYFAELEEILMEMAVIYRCTLMMARTHGQEAELQTFGKRCLAWLQVLSFDLDNLRKAEENLKYSKLSGAIGNYGSTSPELEKEALKILGFDPYYGATQIMPRELYVPIAQALCQIVETIDKIASDIRLGARSGLPIFQEPFGKKQKGSSAMPHKKNTILSEQLEGLARMARGFSDMIRANIKTWEERSIEQSSVERVAWPDLFHVTVRSLKTINKVLSDLVVFPDNMLLEIVASHGCYASSEAKEFLKSASVDFGISAEDAYRIVQLASFNVFEPGKERAGLRKKIPQSLSESDRLLVKAGKIASLGSISIKHIIAEGRLRFSDQLDIPEERIERWNVALKEIFRNEKMTKEWRNIFRPSYLLRNEKILYKEILNI